MLWLLYFKHELLTNTFRNAHYIVNYHDEQACWPPQKQAREIQVPVTCNRWRSTLQSNAFLFTHHIMTCIFCSNQKKEPNSRWDLSSVARKLRHPLQPKNGLMHYSQKVNETHTHWQEVDTTHALQPESQWDSGTLASCTGAWVRVKTCAPVSNDTGFIHH